MDGFLLINKEVGWTSRDVCNKLQRYFHTKHVGHIGTLDPFASGLLIVSINKANKASQFLEAADKTYLATLILGESRDGGDITGEVIEKKEVPSLSKEKIEEVLNTFLGETSQIPPMKSAVWYQGKRLYHYAQNNEIVTPPARKIRINFIELVEYIGNKIIFRCNVSKGTYIRVLGEDIAKKLGTVGYLSNLSRETVSTISLDKAKYVNDITEEDVISISDCLVNIHHVYVNDLLADRAKKGQTIFLKKEEQYDIVLLVDNLNNAIAVYEKVEGCLFKSKRGLF